MKSPLSSAPVPQNSRWRRGLAIAFGALVVLCLGGYLARAHWLYPWASSLAKKRAEEAGYGLEIDSLRGSLLWDLSLEGVSLRPITGGGLSVEGARLEANYSPWRLLRSGLEGIVSLELRADRLAFSLAPGSAAEEGGSAEALPWPSFLPPTRIAVEALALSLTGGAGWHGRGLELSVGSKEGRGQPWKGRLAEGTLTLPGRADWDAPLELEGTYSPDALGIETLTLGDHVRISRARLTSDLALLEVQRLDFEVETNRLIARGLRTPLRFEAGGGPLDVLRAVSGELELSSQDLSPLWPTAEVPLLPPHELQLAGRLGQGELVLQKALAKTQGGELELRQGSLVFGPARAPLSAIRCELDLNLDWSDVTPLADFFGNRWSGRAQGAVGLSGPLDSLQGTASLTASDLTVLGVRIGEAELEASLADRRLDLRRFHSQNEAWQADGQGVYRLDESSFEQLDLSLQSSDLSALVPALGGQLSFHLEGSGSRTRPAGEFDLRADNVAYEGWSLDGLELEGTTVGSDLELRALASFGSAGSLALEGLWSAPDWNEPLQRTTVRLDRLAYEGDGHSLRLESPSEVRLFPDEQTLSPLVLSGELGRLEARGRLAGDELALDVDLQRFHPSPLLALLPETAAWDLEEVRGSLSIRSLAELRAQLELDGLTAPQLPGKWNGSLDAALVGGRLEVSAFEAKADTGHTLALQGSAPLVLGSRPFDAPGELDLTFAGEVSSSLFPTERLPVELGPRARFEAQLDGSWSEVRGSADLEVAAVEAHESSVSLSLSLARGLQVQELLVSLPQGSLTASGSLDATLDLTALTEDAWESLLQAPLQADASVHLSELGWLVEDLSDIRRLAGTLDGELSLSGSLGQPRFRGGTRLRSGELRVPGNLPPLKNIEAQLEFQGHEVAIQQLAGELGSEPFQIQGRALFEDKPELDLRLRGQNLLFSRTSETRVRADADLTVVGPLDRLRTTGELVLTEGKFGRNFDLLSGIGASAPPSAEGRGFQLSFFEQGPLADMLFDVTIRSKRPFLVRNNLVKGSFRPDLRLTGTGAVAVLDGPLYVDDASLKWPAGTLRVGAGLIRFSADDPFRPKLELVAEARMIGYDVRARVTGPYDQPEIELSSDPPLPNEDLLVLFLTGQVPEGGLGQRGRVVAQSMAVYLAKDVVMRWFSGDAEIDEDSFWDRLVFEFGTEVSRTGGQTARVTFYLDHVPRETGWVPYIIGEQDVYDKINFGLGFLFRFR